MTVTRCSTLNGKFSATRVYITSISSPCTDGDDAEYHDGRITTERHAEGEKRKKKKKKTKTRKSSPSVHFLHALSIPPDHFDPPCSTPVHLVTKFTKREFSIPFRVLDPRPTPKSYPPPFSSSRIIPGS